MPAPKKGDLALMAVGDIHIVRKSPTSIFAGVKPLMQGGDVLLANQEAPITDRGTPIVGKVEVGSRHIRSVPATARALKEMDFTAVGLATNHMMDYGAEGLSQTMELLDEVGIPHTGAGRNLTEARRPCIIERDGAKIALLAYTSVYPASGFAAGPDRPGVATVKVHTTYQAPENVFYQPGSPPITITVPDPVETEAMLLDVRQAKEKADLAVVSWHWGVAQGYGRTLGYQKELGRAAIDAGADLVMGHHPHLLLGMELYKGKLICYSLNHFAFEVKSLWHGWLETALVKAYIRDKKFHKFAFVPVLLNRENCDLELPDAGRAREVVGMVERMSREFGTTFTYGGEEVVLGGPAPGTPPPLRAPRVLIDRMGNFTHAVSWGRKMAALFEEG